MAVVHAIDTGFGAVKFTKRNGRSDYTFHSMPSIAALSSGQSLDIGGVFDRLDIASIPVGDLIFNVGNDAAYAQGAYDRQSRDNQYARTPSYKALSLGAVWYMREKVIDRLVVGLPLNTYHANRDYVRTALTGRHRLPSFDTGRLDEGKDVEVEIKSVHVMPQPMGALLYHSAKQPELKLMDQVDLPQDAGIQDVCRHLANDQTKIEAIAVEARHAVAQGRKVLVLTECTEPLDAIKAEHASKTDVQIIDFVDTGHPAQLRMWDKRRRGYRAMGYRVDSWVPSVGGLEG